LSSRNRLFKKYLLEKRYLKWFENGNNLKCRYFGESIGEEST